jgi:hypothetical protein
MVMCTSYTTVFAHLGWEYSKVKLADEARLNNDYDTSFRWYKSISEKSDEYPYACLALGEMYSSEVGNKRYQEAFCYFEEAESNSDDLRILNSCMNFAVQQIKLLYDNPDTCEFNILDNEHIGFIVDVMNKINDLSDVFSCLDINFPVTDDSIKEIFDIEYTLKQTSFYWEYDYTKISEKSNLAYEYTNEKLSFVSSFEELVDTTSFTTVKKYKYYHYQKHQSVETLLTIDAIEQIFPKQEILYLNDL